MGEAVQRPSRVASLAKKFDRDAARDLAKQMTMSEYLDSVAAEPRVSRTAYQRIYDMIVEAGIENHTRYRKTIKKYKFFDDVEVPIFGLEETLYDLVQVFRGAAGGYGTERRLILLRGPVGSSKSTICSLLKKGLERYTSSKTGAIYTYSWKNLDEVPSKDKGWLYNQPTAVCPMHDDPLKLLPDDLRKEVVDELNTTLQERYQKAVREAKAAGKDVKSIPAPHRVMVPGHLNPRCQYFWDQLMAAYDYDWEQVMERHIVVHRFSFNEDKRIGIGTFQPKDEKNQDATELTGDINYMALSHYGVDSDPRAFSFDGEFEIANRGFCEFIEILKLAKEFLYDILGATQERKVKPKKFPQVDIDEVLIGHSVHEDTPVPHEYDGVLDVLPISKLADLDPAKLKVFSVNVALAKVELSPVAKVFSHDFKGDWVVNTQDDGVLTTTPNHSVFDDNLEMFYPGDDETSEIATFEIPEEVTADMPTTERWNDFFAIDEAVEDECLACA